MGRNTKMIHEKSWKREMTFEDVFKQYNNLCKRIAWQFARKYRLEIDIEDLLQMAYVTLWRGYENYEPNRTVGFAHYIEKAIWSSLDRQIKRMIRHKYDTTSIYEFMPDSDNLVLLDRLQDNIDAEEVAIANADIDKIYNLIKDEIDIKILNYLIQGLSRQKIGQKIGMSGQRVQQRIERIRKKLKEAV